MASHWSKIPRGVGRRLVFSSSATPSSLSADAGQREEPGMRIAGRELPGELQYLALSFLTLQELAPLLTLSKGWRSSVGLALERLSAAEVRTMDEYGIAMRYCRRLVCLSSEVTPNALMRANTGTLRAIVLLSPRGSRLGAVIPVVPECRNLTSVTANTAALDVTGAQTLVDTYPALERIQASRIDIGVVLGSKLPLRSLVAFASALLASHIPRLSAHSGLEVLSVHLSFFMTAANYLELFRTLAKLPRLEKVTIVCAHNDEDPVQPPKPLVFQRLRSLGVASEHGDEFSDRLPLPAFSAPALESLLVRLRVSFLSGPEVMRRFPAVTSCTFQDPLFRTAAERSTVVQRFQEGVWKELKTLSLRAWTGSLFLGVLPHLPLALRELSLWCRSGRVSSVLLRALLFGLPQLERLEVMGWPLANDSEAYDEEEISENSAAAGPQSFACDRLTELCLFGWYDLKDHIAGAFEGVTFPKLEGLWLCNVPSDWNLAPLLLRCPLLTRLDLFRCERFKFLLPDEVPSLPRLQHVVIQSCPLLRTRHLTPLLKEDAYVYVPSDTDDEDEESSEEAED